MNRTHSNIKPIEFTCDGITLRGILHLPCRSRNGSPDALPPLVIGSHGLEGSMESAKQQVLARIVPEAGGAFFRFDHRGCGTSGGDFTRDTSLSKRVQDILCGVKHIQSMGITQRRIILFGSSLGGAASISAWSMLGKKNMEPAGAIICAAPVNSLTIKAIPLGGNDLRPALPMSFFEKNLLFDLSDKLHLLHHVLIFHGDGDAVVPVENAYAIHANVRNPKKLIIARGGDHQMSNPRDQELFARETKNWLKVLMTTFTGS
ncbi:MAG: alpha/beta hydrolase [Desulfamplus sp.]|nr:alpha/beta hydrolase [Desulfamplus sp.]